MTSVVYFVYFALKMFKSEVSTASKVQCE